LGIFPENRGFRGRKNFIEKLALPFFLFFLLHRAQYRPVDWEKEKIKPLSASALVHQFALGGKRGEMTGIVFQTKQGLESAIKRKAANIVVALNDFKIHRGTIFTQERKKILSLRSNEALNVGSERRRASQQIHLGAGDTEKPQRQRAGFDKTFFAFRKGFVHGIGLLSLEESPSGERNKTPR